MIVTVVVSRETNNSACCRETIGSIRIRRGRTCNSELASADDEGPARQLKSWTLENGSNDDQITKSRDQIIIPLPCSGMSVTVKTIPSAFCLVCCCGHQIRDKLLSLCESTLIGIGLERSKAQRPVSNVAPKNSFQESDIKHHRKAALANIATVLRKGRQK